MILPTNMTLSLPLEITPLDPGALDLREDLPDGAGEELAARIREIIALMDPGEKRERFRLDQDEVIDLDAEVIQEDVELPAPKPLEYFLGDDYKEKKSEDETMEPYYKISDEKEAKILDQLMRQTKTGDEKRYLIATESRFSVELNFARIRKDFYQDARPDVTNDEILEDVTILADQGVTLDAPRAFLEGVESIYA